MITLLGVGHVFDLSRPVRDAILVRRPRVVALELDAVRFQGLMARAPRAKGLSVLALLAGFEARIAREYGVSVGDEMVAAAHAAQEAGAEIALIDDDSRAVLARAWRAMSFQERVRLLVSVVGSVFLRRKRVDEEIRRFEENEGSVIEEFAKELPAAKRVLIDERDERMGARLRDLHTAKGDVVAVVGDGHVRGIAARLEGLPVDVVRLKDLREGPATGGASASVSVHL